MLSALIRPELFTCAPVAASIATAGEVRLPVASMTPALVISALIPTIANLSAVIVPVLELLTVALLSTLVMAVPPWPVA